MERRHSNASVTVYPFTYHLDTDEAIIANATTSSYLAIPEPALGLLSDLAAGRTVAEAEDAYRRKYGETPDVWDFLDLLASEGFVSLDSDSPPTPSESAAQSSGAPAPRRYHFENISEEWARRAFGWPVLAVCGLLVGMAVAAVVDDPGLLPSPTAMVFPDHLTVLGLAVFGFILATIFLHELAHLVAARAAGASARLTVSNRLWYLVAETDLTGVWLAPRRRRYLAFLAGPLLDAASAALLILALWTDHRWHWLPLYALLLGRAFLFTYLVRLLWQGFLFVRTDLYFVLATFFGCKNLMDDTQDWLRNQLARVWSGLRAVDQSRIPRSELRVIRVYAAVWIVGRGLALGTLVLITLPILWGYALRLIELIASQDATAASRLDGLVFIGLTLAVEGTGLVVWLRSMVRSRLTSNSG